MKPLEALQVLRSRVGEVFYGNPMAVDQILSALLARGHVLIEDVPGVGKTLLAMTLARCIDAKLSRIQLTPDALPADIIGSHILDRDNSELRFIPGPIFANIVLADEINRTPPRTQSALLEAMAEATVTVDGNILSVEPPFIVIATQNPSAFHGTYPLPENQLDRFLMRVHLGYPTPDNEARILEERPQTRLLPDVDPVMTRDVLLAAQAHTDQVRVDPAITKYIVALAERTRNTPEFRLGVSPRGSLALAQAARAWATLQDRDYCVPEDVTENVMAVWAHRVIPELGHQGTDLQVTEAALTQVMMSTSPPT